MTERMHGTKGDAATHPVKCPAALDQDELAGGPHTGPHRCLHPAPTAAENEVPGFLEHQCGYVGCNVLWTRPSPAMARMGVDELRVLVDGIDPVAKIRAEESAAQPCGFSASPRLAGALVCDLPAGHSGDHASGVEQFRSGTLRSGLTPSGHLPCPQIAASGERCERNAGHEGGCGVRFANPSDASEQR